MSYLGKEPQFTQYPSKFFNGDGSAMTVTLDYAPPNAAALLVFIDGVRQDTSAYTLAGGTSLTFTGAVPSGTNNVQVVHLGLAVDVGIPGDDTISTAKLQDDAVTADKLASGLANATHTGDVTGATALTIANDAVDIAMLSATGTADATTFLRGDNSWAEAGGGKVLQYVSTEGYSGSISVDNNTTPASAGATFLVSITPTATDSKILIQFGSAYGGTQSGNYPGKAKLYRQIASGGYSSLNSESMIFLQNYAANITPWGSSYTDSPSTTSACYYQLYVYTGGNDVAYFTANDYYRFIRAWEIGA